MSKDFDKVKLELNKVDEAIAYLNKWDDMPFDYLYKDCCKMLQINANEAGKDFIKMLLIRTRQQSAEILASIRK